MNAKQRQERIREIQQIAGLKPTHFADLIRVAQLVYDPRGGISSRVVRVNWLNFGISKNVAENLKLLGQKYQYELPHIAPDLVWDELEPETRSWFIAHKSILWKIEESFPTLDED
ncbi:Exonuclease ATPase Subunit [Geitlerinema sp. FC II]|nr:Exonuclease ATPase Subunit [Geitlerinema sp. FC II]